LLHGVVKWVLIDESTTTFHEHKFSPSSKEVLIYLIFNMYCSTLFSSLLIVGATLITTAQAGCYPVGHSLLKTDLLYHAKRACKGYDGKKGAFQGYFNPNQRKKACVNIGVAHVDMEVGNLNPSAGFDLNDDDCYKELANVIQTCVAPFELSQGGRFDVAGWTFRSAMVLFSRTEFLLNLLRRVDPNAGKC
jgi:hypothetical protein